MRNKYLMLAMTTMLVTQATPLWAAKEKADLIIRNVTVVDVGDAHIVPGQAVVIRGDTIAAVGPDKDIQRNWQSQQKMDGRGRYIIPGLWDMHVHFGGGPELIEENKALLPLYIANGITTVRDCSGDLPYEGPIAK